ncbi:MAG TPA: diguanylate phosphodiesterase, partial [Marinobacter hydrocarbonoclasticus]|nr:diguanylate phosphodiesterase [Marinobacter nauticus]
IEHHTLNIQVGEWVLRNSLLQIQRWEQEGVRVNVSVNIAANHLQSDNFAGHLTKILSAFPGVDPVRLDLEILETAALGDLDKAVQTIADCRELGVTFSLDDFGTGYSSLSYLKRLPVDTLKIDREFVSGIEDNGENLSILQGVIGLSRVFGKQVVAEGVESVRQGEILLSLGCEYAQGFAISPPIEATLIPAWINRWRTFREWALTRVSENP